MMKTDLSNSIRNGRWGYLSQPVNLTDRGLLFLLRRQPEPVPHENTFIRL
jgi:hypothetical protein